MRVLALAAAVVFLTLPLAGPSRAASVYRALGAVILALDDEIHGNQPSDEDDQDGLRQDDPDPRFGDDDNDDDDSANGPDDDDDGWDIDPYNRSERA
ncbi:MAG: hypothetical protein AB7S70_08095 [Hyphomicrobium sp.]|uniref:hypothetical protein n=1 Tax=Hyphomicrobium sp. TaxID=82 RepID=UPI003D0D5CEF